MLSYARACNCRQFSHSMVLVFFALIVDCEMNEITELPVNKVKKYNVEEVFSCETSKADQKTNPS